MDCARPGRAHADPQLAGVLRKAGCHEGGGFFVSHTDVTNAVAALAQRLDDGVDAVAHDAEHVCRAPRDQGFDHDVGRV